MTLDPAQTIVAAASLGYVFIAYEVPVNVAFTAARERLARIVDADGLTVPSQAAYECLMSVGPFGDVLGLSKLVQVRVIAPVQRARTVTAPLRWEATGATGGLFPVLDADLILAADGEDKTRIALTGCYRPPFGWIGAGLDRAVLRHAAMATIRALVRSIADAITSSATTPEPEQATSR